MFYKNANWDLFGLCAYIGQFGDKLPLDSKSEWCNRNSESLVVAEECKSKVDLETGRVVCAVTAG